MAERFNPAAAPICGAYYLPRRNATLREWLAVYPDNWITRAFCGRHFLLDRPLPPVTRDHLEIAKRYAKAACN